MSLVPAVEHLAAFVHVTFCAVGKVGLQLLVVAQLGDRLVLLAGLLRVLRGLPFMMMRWE